MTPVEEPAARRHRRRLEAHHLAFRPGDGLHWDGLQETHVDLGRPAPIAAVLVNLRNAAITSATRPGDCFRNYPKKGEKGDANTYELGLKITSTGKADVTVGLAPIDVTAGVENKSSTGNTLIVTFAQRITGDRPGEHFVPAARRRAEAVPAGQQPGPANRNAPTVPCTGDCKGIHTPPDITE